MGTYAINGKRRLCGEITVQGSKNSAVAILMACLITEGENIITNIPCINDVKLCLKLLKMLGCSVTYDDPVTVRINTLYAEPTALPHELTSGMRASSYLIGSLTARFGECPLPSSGGCDFGSRPIDMHINALKSLGATETNGIIKAEKGLTGSKIIFPIKTVGGTVNAIISATKASGITIIENAAKEPHIKDLCAFLRKCGADITGGGTDTIRIRGRRKLHGAFHCIDSDMIEAGTYICAALATGGEIRCAHAPIGELSSFFEILRCYGADIEAVNNCVTVKSNERRAVNVTTAPYPGFPTDLQPQLCALLGLGVGKSKITETVFKNRFGYLKELTKFGLDHSVNGSTVEITGKDAYLPAKVTATDLRGGAAEVICALCSEGKSIINGIELIERGYYDMPEKLISLGADIVKN